MLKLKQFEYYSHKTLVTEVFQTMGVLFIFGNDHLYNYVTWYEKIGLMCTYNLTALLALKFHNFLLKPSLSTKRLILVQHAVGN